MHVVDVAYLIELPGNVCAVIYQTMGVCVCASVNLCVVDVHDVLPFSCTNVLCERVLWGPTSASR